MNNFIQINDWEIKNFFKFIVIMQFIVLSTIILETMGLQILYLRNFFVFIYITFLPGLLILRILKLHKLGNSNTLLYAIGLSILFLMVIGFLVNLIYPIFGISRPISTINLITTISFVMFVLCVLSYLRDKDFFSSSEINIGILFSNPALFLYLLPILVINGTYLVNYYHNNILLMIVILIISSIPLLITFSKFIPKKLYPLTIFIIALSLLYHKTLISPYLTGWDIQGEYYFYNLVEMNGFWNSSLVHNSNSVLSVTLFPAIYSKLMNLDGAFVFKIVYPFLFAFVPLGLYNIFKKQTDEKMAFLSVFYFISLFTFYTEMTALGKQQIAEIFYMLLILTMIDDNIDDFIKSFFYILFGAGVVFSHYGMSYLYMLMLIFTLFIFKFVLKHTSNVFTSVTVLRFIVLGIFWNIYNTSSSSFVTIINIGENIIKNINLFLSPESTQALSLLMTKPTSLLHLIFKIFYYISQFFIIIGIMNLLFSIIKGKKIRYDDEFVAFSITNFLIFLLVIFIPMFLGMRIKRIYHIMTFFLAPFFIIGWIEFSNKVSIIFSWKTNKMNNQLRILSIFLAIFLLLNSGFIFEIANDHPNSISLSQESIKQGGSIERINNYYSMFFTDYDVYGVRWISTKRDNQTKIYADFARKELIFTSYGMMLDECLLLKNTTIISGDSYLYLGYQNLKYGIMSGHYEPITYWNITDMLTLINQKNKIYSNRGSIVYK